MNNNDNEIVLYQPNETITIEVRLQEDSVWLTQQQIADLFGTKRPAITKHLKNIYSCGELEESSTCSILELMGNDGKQRYSTKYYNLDAILSVGYRVNSINATAFRRWANQVLKEYLLRGYAIRQQLQAFQFQLDSRFNEQDKRIRLLEEKCDQHSEKIDFFIRTSLPPVEVQTNRKTELRTTRSRVHDRFLIIDDQVYHMGASLKDLGRKLFAFSKMGIDKSLLMSQVL